MKEGMYHASLSVISRSAGRSATAAAAYRSGISIVDERTGVRHDYARKRGVVWSRVALPRGVPLHYKVREILWNAAEQAETRVNSTVAREWVLALPCDLPEERLKVLVDAFVNSLVTEFGVAASYDIHDPDKEVKNPHVHVLFTTRRLGSAGFEKKTREWDDQKTGKELTVKYRKLWADLLNEEYSRLNRDVRVSHLSLHMQGIDRIPTVKERGVPAKKALNSEIRRANERLEALDSEAAELHKRLRKLELNAPRSSEQPRPWEPAAAPPNQQTQSRPFTLKFPTLDVAPSPSNSFHGTATSTPRPAPVDPPQSLRSKLLDELSGLERQRQQAATYDRGTEALAETIARHGECKRKLKLLKRPNAFHVFFKTAKWKRFSLELQKLQRRERFYKQKSETIRKQLGPLEGVRRDWEEKQGRFLQLAQLLGRSPSLTAQGTHPDNADPRPQLPCLPLRLDELLRAIDDGPMPPIDRPDRRR